MRFTEQEMTAGLTGAAKAVLASRRGKVRRGQDVDEVWSGMTRFERFTVLDGIGTQVLPVLVGLPDQEIAPDTRASYDDAAVAEVVERLLDEGAPGGGRVRRAVTVKARVALVQLALSHMPPRRDPDGLLVPDSLEGL